ncbi:hypothetical protein SH449x_002454 [Pirellulaceae bacterium SH449]
MLLWKKIERRDKIGLLACAAIILKSAQHDEMPPVNLVAAINSVEQHVADGANVEIGSFRDDPVVVLIWDEGSLAVWCVPEVRRHRLESIALGYGLSEAIRAGGTSIDLFCDSLPVYEMAKELGFVSFSDDQDLEECLLYQVEKEVSRVY